MKNIIILGSTGSIGTQALDVISSRRDQYRVTGIGAGGAHVELLAKQAAEFEVPIVALAVESAAAKFREAFAAVAPEAPMPEIIAGARAMSELSARATSEDVVLNGITGSVGLGPTLSALAAGATLALANKESLVAGGPLVRAAMVRPGQIVPVDSEHSAIAQALRSGEHHRGLTADAWDGESAVRKIILTASGGPFRGKRASELSAVTPEQALAHPTWNMGPVVTINSSTLFNKGLELIEAAYLFAVPPEDIVPVVHPQSAVHSMVEFIDGAVIAQASPPDMRLPIALGLSWPDRLADVTPAFTWDSAMSWTFEPLDHEAFPAVGLARAALGASPWHPAVLNAANEQCVYAFLDGKFSFLGITAIVSQVLEDFNASEWDHIAGASEESLEQVLAVEAWARAHADELIARGA